MWNKKENVTEEWNALPNTDYFSPDFRFCLSSLPSPLPGRWGSGVGAGDISSLVSNPETISSSWLSQPGKEKSYCPHNLALLPSWSFPGMASNSIKSSFFTEQLQPRLSLWEWNATNCGASIVWAIQWAFHFQSKSKLVKVSLYKLPCWETAACIKITIILFCHVRSKG